MKRKMIYTVLAVLVLILLSVALVRIIRHFQIQACINKGGYWNKELNRCEMPDSTVQLMDYYWHTAYDSTLQREFLQKGRLTDSISSTSADLISILNKRQEKCKIQYIAKHADTLHIRILNEEVLTEQLGSTGAYSYLGETVFTLTENDSVKHVKIAFSEGSHASPGVYARSDFNDLIQNKQ